MIVRTDAVVLRAFDYGETSRIVNLFTRQHGRISVLAKGARRPKSRFGATLQPLAFVQTVYYYRDGRGLQTLKEASHLRLWKTTATDLGRLTVGMRIVELVRALFEEGEVNAPAFRLLIDHLTALDAAPDPVYGVLPHFQLALATLLGFAPDIQRDAVEAVDEAGGVLLLDTGRVGPLAAAARSGTRASRAALRAFAIYARVDLRTALQLRLDPEVQDEVQALTDAFLRFHAQDAFPDRVRKVTAQMEHGAPPPVGDGA